MSNAAANIPEELIDRFTDAIHEHRVDEVRTLLEDTPGLASYIIPQKKYATLAARVGPFSILQNTGTLLAYTVAASGNIEPDDERAYQDYTDITALLLAHGVSTRVGPQSALAFAAHHHSGPVVRALLAHDRSDLETFHIAKMKTPIKDVAHSIYDITTRPGKPNEGLAKDLLHMTKCIKEFCPYAELDTPHVHNPWPILLQLMPFLAKTVSYNGHSCAYVEETIDALLEAGADPDARSSEGKTYLQHHLSDRINDAQLKKLLYAGASQDEVVTGSYLSVREWLGWLGKKHPLHVAYLQVKQDLARQAQSMHASTETPKKLLIRTVRGEERLTGLAKALAEFGLLKDVCAQEPPPGCGQNAMLSLAGKLEELLPDRLKERTGLLLFERESALARPGTHALVRYAKGLAPETPLKH